ncbi:MAG: GatB/YqeY domain-containing protein [Bacillales bacterium]
MLIDEIKKENILALKNKDNNKRVVYSILINKYTLLGYEYKAKGKEISDEDMLNIIKKTVKELEEERKSFIEGKRDEEVKNITCQIDTISSYLPKTLSEEEILKIFLSLEDKSISNVMRYFKTTYGAGVDMGLVNKIMREQREK